MAFIDLTKVFDSVNCQAGSAKDWLPRQIHLGAESVLSTCWPQLSVVVEMQQNPSEFTPE